MVDEDSQELTVTGHVFYVSGKMIFLLIRTRKFTVHFLNFLNQLSLIKKPTYIHVLVSTS